MNEVWSVYMEVKAGNYIQSQCKSKRKYKHKDIYMSEKKNTRFHIQAVSKTYDHYCMTKVQCSRLVLRLMTVLFQFTWKECIEPLKNPNSYTHKSFSSACGYSLCVYACSYS